MAQKFNISERLVARVLSRFPASKQVIKRIYQYLNSVLFKKSYAVSTKYQLNCIEIADESFFGYYDKSPLSANNRYLLFHSTAYSTKNKPSADSPIKINVFDIYGNHKLIWEGDSYAYNWQQGSRAQWLNEDSFIFNIYDENNRRYGSKRVNLATSEEIVYPFPVYDTFNSYALSLNFKRLAALRPDYGYRNADISVESDIRNLDEDGILLCDFETRQSKLLLSLSQLVSIEYDSKMDEATHKVNHIMISPKGDKFIFLHRYFIKQRRFDRLFVSDSQGTNIKLLAAQEMVSHCCWLNNNTVIGYLRGNEGDRYYKIDVNTGRLSIIGEGIIDRFGDGHPSILKAELMLFDSYPDRSRMKGLYIYNIKTNVIEKVGEFYEGLNYYGETRCDLHPRFSCDGGKVFVDSVHEGKRQLHWIDLNRPL